MVKFFYSGRKLEIKKLNVKELNYLRSSSKIKVFLFNSLKLLKTLNLN